MKYTCLILFLFFKASSLFSQDCISGIYYFFAPCVSHRLNLDSDSSFVRTVNGRGPVYKEIGRWVQRNDTVVLYTSSKCTGIELNVESKDTLYLRVVSFTYLASNFIRFKKQVEYYPNGKIKLEIKGFMNYPLTGVVTRYYENEKIEDVTNYRKGKKHGQYLKYNKEGILIVVGKWRRDKRVGKWKNYYDNGLSNPV